MYSSLRFIKSRVPLPPPSPPHGCQTRTNRAKPLLFLCFRLAHSRVSFFLNTFSRTLRPSTTWNNIYKLNLFRLHSLDSAINVRKKRTENVIFYVSTRYITRNLSSALVTTRVYYYYAAVCYYYHNFQGNSNTFHSFTLILHSWRINLTLFTMWKIFACTVIA